MTAHISLSTQEVSSSFSPNSTYALTFGDQCSAIGNDSSVIVRVPAITANATGGRDITMNSQTPRFEKYYTAKITAPSAHSKNTTLIGYGAVANHVIAAFSSPFSLLEVDPLAVVSTSIGCSSPEEAAEQGCHTHRRLAFSDEATMFNSLEPFHFAAIGDVSGVLLLRNASSQNKITVACVPNVSALFAEQQEQSVSVRNMASAIEISDQPVEVSSSAAEVISVTKSLRLGKHKIQFQLSDGTTLITIEQNSLTDKLTISTSTAATGVDSSSAQQNDLELSITTSATGDSAPFKVSLKKDDYRPIAEECCFCMMNLFPTAEEEDVMPAVGILSCGHGYHRGCLDMDLSRVDDFVRDGRYFRFRRLCCSVCSRSMHDSLRFPALEPMFQMRRTIDKMAKELDAKNGGSAGDDEPLDERLKRHLFYMCNKCKEPFYGGPYDCGATLSDPKANPETLICDKCCDDFSCQTHGNSSVVYKCLNCWNPAVMSKRFLGRLRLCVSCFDAQKGKSAPSDDIVPIAKKNHDKGTTFAAPSESPFAFLGKDGWAVCGHDGEGVGLSVAGCAECSKELREIVKNQQQQQQKKAVSDKEEVKEKSPDAAEK